MRAIDEKLNIGTAGALALAVASLLLVGTACAEPRPSFHVHLHDGSLIAARASSGQLSLRSPTLGELQLAWANVHSLAFADGGVVVGFANGDRLSGTLPDDDLAVATAFGQISIPVDQVRAVTDIEPGAVTRENIALGKPVSGPDGASHGKGLAKHLTDGDLSTHAKPPSFHFDYTVDLRDTNGGGRTIGEIVIHWGHYGDRFKGIRKGDGWASGSWPGEYVKFYQIDYRCAPGGEWLELHRCDGRPADETGERLTVERAPTQREGASSDVTTAIGGLELEDVAEIRIRARGGHWVGLYELEVFSEG